MAKKHLFELTFNFAKSEPITALIEEDDANCALRSLMSVWQPGEEIISVVIEPRTFFQVHIPSLSGYPKEVVNANPCNYTEGLCACDRRRGCLAPKDEVG